MNIFEKSRKYEVEFCELYNKENKKKVMTHIDEAFKADFEVTYSNNKTDTIELKTDFHKNSKNFFMETISNVSSGRVGGPLQAQGYEAKYFVVWFPEDLKDNLWVFETDELVKWLEKNKNKYHYVDIKNDTYYTRGRIIPKADFLCQEMLHLKVKTMKSNGSV